MREFEYRKLKDKAWSGNVLMKVAHIHEAKARQEFYLSRKPEELDRLLEISKIESTQASNAIEGIRTTDFRLKQLMNGKTAPKNRSEKEIAGYRDALKTIHDSFEFIPVTPNYILQLHSILLSHDDEVNYAGKYKDSQNYISGVDENGNGVTLFTPLSPLETPLAMQSLCEEYSRATERKDVEPLVLIPIFIHDFLCIHPFNDGNGRMSRLLTTLLLCKQGYLVGKYISLEAKISKTKDLYYDALLQSQAGWHEGKDDPTPFVEYLLGIIEMAYEDFEDRAKPMSSKASAYEMVASAIGQKIGKISKSEVAELCPSLSISAIEKAMAKMAKEGKIEKRGSGKLTYYVIKA